MNLPLHIAVLVSAVFLGIESAAMCALGRTHGRRSSPDMRAIVTRAGLWSLVLSWTLVIIPLPAWLVLGSQIGWILGLGNIPSPHVWFTPYGGVPWAWLSIACSLSADVVSAVRNRSRTES